MASSDAGPCGIARHLGEDVPCPGDSCGLLVALGYPSRTPSPPDCPAAVVAERWGLSGDVVANLRQAVGDVSPFEGLCPVEAIAARAAYDTTVLKTLDALRRELDRAGAALPLARARRTRADRHEAALERWPVQS